MPLLLMINLHTTTPPSPRSILRFLKVRDFSYQAVFKDPCLTFVLPETICSYCNVVRPLDLCRDKVCILSFSIHVCLNMHCLFWFINKCRFLTLNGASKCMRAYLIMWSHVFCIRSFKAILQKRWRCLECDHDYDRTIIEQVCISVLVRIHH